MGGGVEQPVTPKSNGTAPTQRINANPLRDRPVSTDVFFISVLSFLILVLILVCLPINKITSYSRALPMGCSPHNVERRHVEEVGATGDNYDVGKQSYHQTCL
jgi:hypothetical protein